jgi:tetratricopeptide (TPR) repeat protein
MKKNVRSLILIPVFLLTVLQAFAIPKEIENALKLNRINHFDEALRVMEEALEQGKINPDITSAYTIGRILYRKGELFREMSQITVLAQIAHLEQIREREKSLTGELSLYLGIGYFYNSRFDDAAATLNRVINSTGMDAAMRSLAVVYLGAAYYRTGEREKAQEFWKQVGQDHGYALATLGFMYAYLGINPATAESTIERALNKADSIYRNSIEVYHSYALMASGRYTDAYNGIGGIDLDKPIFFYRPDDVTEIRFYDLAVLDAYSRIIFGESIKNLEPVVNASSGELASFASYYVAQMYLYLEDYEQCINFASRAQKLSVSSSLTMIRAVSSESAAYYLSGKERKGQRLIQREIEKIYGKPSFLLEMMRVLITSGVAFETVEGVIRGAESYIFDVQWDRTRRDMALLGELAFFSGDYNRALSYLEQARDKGNKNKIETNDPTFLLKLSYVYYNREDFSESLEVLFSLGKSFSGVRPLQDSVQSVYSYKQRGSGETIIE